MSCPSVMMSMTFIHIFIRFTTVFAVAKPKGLAIDLGEMGI